MKIIQMKKIKKIKIIKKILKEKIAMSIKIIEEEEIIVIIHKNREEVAKENRIKIRIRIGVVK